MTLDERQLELRTRQEGDIVPEGFSITETSRSLYIRLQETITILTEEGAFYKKKKTVRFTIRIPKPLISLNPKNWSVSVATTLYDADHDEEL